MTLPPGFPLPDPLPQDLLAGQRRILVNGVIDTNRSNDLCARLMTFDGQSDATVELLVSGPGGPVADILPVLDVLALMRGPVATTCLGSAEGTAAALVAAGSGSRRARAGATVCLRVDDRHSIEGRAGDVSERAGELVALMERYLDALVAATGQDRDWLAHQVARGTRLDAGAALERGLLDAIIDIEGGHGP